MNIDSEHLWTQIALGADTSLELMEVRFRRNKLVAPRRNSIADELAAFGNAGGGQMVLGITDDRQPQNLDSLQLDALGDVVREVCVDNIKPPLNYQMFRVGTQSGYGALVIDIHEGVDVHQSPGGYFRREGDSKRRMGSAKIHKLLFARGQSDDVSTDTRVIPDSAVHSLSPSHWRRYVSSRLSEPTEVALSKLRFARTDSQGVLRATLAGVLLASDDPRKWIPNAWIQAVCYRVDRQDSSLQLDASDISGPLDQQIRDAVRFVVRNRRVAAYKDLGRTDIPQFSARAVFEAVVNAVVHRDYAVHGSRIRLFMFDDRLELYSPGGLCNSMSTEDLRNSQFTRNELLASRLGQCAVGDVPGSGGRQYFIERRGEGIGVIQDETFALAGQYPIFELIGERELKVVLPAARVPEHDGVAASVMVVNSETGKPLPGIDVLMLYPNKTYRKAKTDAFGRVELVLHAKLPMTVFCAAPGFRAHVTQQYQPGLPLEVVLTPTEVGGSMIIADRSGHLDGIRGRLNPILDSHDRMYLYADNVAVNDGKAQPVRFSLNEPVKLTDSFGACATVWFREMRGASCVLDYAFRQP